MTLDFGVLRVLLLVKKLQIFGTPKVRHWIHDGVYQLQRFAYEAQGIGSWTRQTKETPITKDKLRDLFSNGAGLDDAHMVQL